ncbi:hypothetical protein [Castellaniella denitrificans]|uniref:Uncharacterized protein n=1 Tax=Castellaniella denitrificans TaxID=56119 RepID=A0ABT4LZL6_9BURK|nr:hypothetical protein [Castellaniella denitrificans]MCZ4328497.1 hypothetical protein [Castellaniella denitrificans]
MTPAMSNILSKIRQAAQSDCTGLSTAEALIAALVLDRPDWLIDMKFTIPEALDRIGPQWAELIPEIARIWKQELATQDSRFSYEILPRSEDMGGGYQLRLLEAGQEVGGGVFPAQSGSPGRGLGDLSYSEAVATAHAWLDSRRASPGR